MCLRRGRRSRRLGRHPRVWLHQAGLVTSVLTLRQWDSLRRLPGLGDGEIITECLPGMFCGLDCFGSQNQWRRGGRDRRQNAPSFPRPAPWTRYDPYGQCLGRCQPTVIRPSGHGGEIQRDHGHPEVARIDWNQRVYHHHWCHGLPKSYRRADRGERCRLRPGREGESTVPPRGHKGLLRYSRGRPIRIGAGALLRTNRSGPWTLRSASLLAREWHLHLARPASLGRIAGIGMPVRTPWSGRVSCEHRYFITSSAEMSARLPVPCVHIGASRIACIGDSMSPCARTKVASVAPTHRPTSIPSVNSPSTCSSAPDLPAASNRTSSKPLGTMTSALTWCFNSRVVPLDNFMIYKDIIRLDRPDWEQKEPVR